MTTPRYTEVRHTVPTIEWESLPVLGQREQRWERIDRLFALFIAVAFWSLVAVAIWHWVS